MNKNICCEQMREDPSSVIQRSSNDTDSFCYKIPQSVAPKAKPKKTNVLDYKNIPLTLTGEISSECIHRNNLTQKQLVGSFIENMENDDDDEQFILNLKKNIDENMKKHRKYRDNYRDLQSKSYLSRKKKSIFSDEDQNLIKRFKKSVEDNKVCVASSEIQQRENVSPVHRGDFPITNTSQVTPIFNNIDIALRNNTDQLLFHMTSKMQKNGQLITSDNTETITETEIEELIYYELQYLTPPRQTD